jgi:hypothetical protein
MTPHVEIAIQGEHSGRPPGQPPPPAGPLNRLKFFLGGILIATAAVAVLIVGLVLGSIIAAVASILLVIGSVVLILRMALRRGP